ncbi:MAG TPA: N-acetylmuramoyl-L-alanine amidase [Pseudolabrys sp.]|nr:N-acetylmuramoyl-L-alanine amidase [Pseudolabrys sp.]
MRARATSRDGYRWSGTASRLLLATMGVALAASLCRAQDAPPPPALPAAKSASKPETKPETKPACNRPAFRVVLDIGHTTDDPGAISARGTGEFVFNQVLALDIEHRLADAGFSQVTMLLEAGPGKRSLYRRMARANRLAGDIFLSIHHDAVPDSFLKDWEYEGKTRHFSDRFKGHSIFVSYANRHARQSLQLARLIGRQMKARELRYTPHYAETFMGRYRRQLLDADVGVYRYDRLHVLKTSRAPAVLLEAGSILNREEELALATPERRALIADAVAAAIEDYCALTSPTNRIATRHKGRAKHSRAAVNR